MMIDRVKFPSDPTSVRLTSGPESRRWPSALSTRRTGKRYGRIGDSPIIVSGTYANNRSVAVSATGAGEFFIRGTVAHDISALVEYKGMTVDDAAREVIFEKLAALKGDGGVIAIDRHGNISMPFNTEGMYRASIDTSGKVRIMLYGEKAETDKESAR